MSMGLYRRKCVNVIFMPVWGLMWLILCGFETSFSICDCDRSYMILLAWYWYICMFSSTPFGGKNLNFGIHMVSMTFYLYIWLDDFWIILDYGWLVNLSEFLAYMVDLLVGYWKFSFWLVLNILSSYHIHLWNIDTTVEILKILKTLVFLTKNNMFKNPLSMYVKERNYRYLYWILL